VELFRCIRVIRVVMLLGLLVLLREKRTALVAYDFELLRCVRVITGGKSGSIGQCI
jgi:hypothetical protein